MLRRPVLLLLVPAVLALPACKLVPQALAPSVDPADLSGREVQDLADSLLLVRSDVPGYDSFGDDDVPDDELLDEGLSDEELAAEEDLSDEELDALLEAEEEAFAALEDCFQDYPEALAFGESDGYFDRAGAEVYSSSSVYEDAATAQEEIAILQDPDEAQCYADEAALFFASEPDVVVVSSEGEVFVTSPPPGADDAFALRITTFVETDGEGEVYVNEYVGVRVGPAVVALDTYGTELPFPPRERTRLLAVLTERAVEALGD